MSVFAIMVIPAATVDSGSVGPEFWGMGSMVLFDASGNEVFAQSVHNLVTDQGEEYLIDAVFQEGATAIAENISIASICVTDAASPVIADTHTAAQFEIDNAIDTGLNCIEDTVVGQAADGKAVIGPLTFGAANIDTAGDTITAIGICQAASADDTHFGCEGAVTGILFATVDIANTQLNAGETVQITYTFDISA